jgi:hypothetical protein
MASSQLRDALLLQQAAQEREAQERLPRPEIEITERDGGETHTESWTVDFLTMQGTRTMRGGGPRTPHYERFYMVSVKRSSDGAWAMRESNTHYEAKVRAKRKEYETERAEHDEGPNRQPFLTWEDWAPEYYLAPPDWEPIPDNVATAVETRYQLFLRNWQGM